MPNLYIIAGCNGAGKTTASQTILPDVLNCKEFLNADAIAAGISPYNVESVAFQSGRIMLERIQFLINEKENFAFETTLSTKSYIQLIKLAKAKGYTVTLLFFWLKNPELAVSRVENRVRQGGHFIPEDIIKRRYFRGVYNLFNHFINLCQVWMIFDNSFTIPMLIAKGIEKDEIEVLNKDSYQLLKSYAKQ
jgi:predicted ABC-type ATPase